MNMELFDRQKENLTRRIKDLIENLANIVKTQRGSYASMVSEIKLHERTNPDRAKELKEENQGIRAVSNSLLVKQLEQYEAPLQESCSALGIDPPYRFSSQNSPDSGRVSDDIKEKCTKVKIELKNLDLDKHVEVEASTNAFMLLIRPPLEKYLAALKTMLPRPDYVRDTDNADNSAVVGVAIRMEAYAEEPTTTDQAAQDEENARIARKAIKERTGSYSEKEKGRIIDPSTLPSIESQIMPSNMGGVWSPSLQSNRASLEEDDYGWDYWKAMELWTIHEAEYLVLGCTRPDTQAYVNSLKWARSIGHECEPPPPGFEKLHKMVWVALRHGSLRCSVDPKDMRHINSTDVFRFDVNPGEFIRWCATKGIDMPDPLRSLLDLSSSVEEDDDLLEDEANSEEQGDAHIENYVFRKDGASWEIIFDGNRLRPVKHMLGFEHIAAILERPRKLLSTTELTRMNRMPAATGTPDVDMYDGSVTESKTLNNIAVDPSEEDTLDNLRKRIGELEREIDEEKYNEAARKELIKEKQEITDLITSRYDKDGQPRSVNEDKERPRNAVCGAIKRAYKKLEKNEDGLEVQRHLLKFIELGSGIMYNPPDGISWITR